MRENEDSVAQKLVVIEDDKSTKNSDRDSTQDVVLVEDDNESPKPAESVKENNTATKSKSDVSYSWSCYETVAEVDNLIKCLAFKGIRESALLTALKENRDDIVWSVKKRCKSNIKRVEDKEVEKDDRLLTSLIDDMVDIAQRVFKGKLCEMKNIDRYEKDVNSAVQPRKLSKLLLKLYESVFPRAHKLQKPEKWKEAVQDACTFSRLHLLLDILDEAILWDKSTERAKCKLCRRKADEKNLLVCCSNSDCALAYHLLCLRPSLDEMPKHSWLCPVCQPPETPRNRRRNGVVYAEDDTDEDDDEADNQDSGSSVSSDFHEDYCDVCDEGGDELVCCDTCPSVYHMECHDPPLRNVPRGSWQCCKCRWGITKKSKSMISAANKKLKAAKKNAKRAAGSKRKRLRLLVEDDCHSDSPSEEYCFHSSDESQSFNSSVSSNNKPYRKSTRNATKNKPTVKENAKKRQAFEEESKDRENLPARKKTRRTSKDNKKRDLELKDNFEDGERKPKDKKLTNKRSQKDGSRASPELIQNSANKRHRTNPELGKCEGILSKLWLDENSWPFRAPVNTKEVPDYAELVTNPMDLRTVQEKLDTIQYKDAGEFVSDIRLILRNCEMYNLNTSEVGLAGIQIEKYFNTLLKEEFPHLSKLSRRRRK